MSGETGREGVRAWGSEVGEKAEIGAGAVVARTERLVIRTFGEGDTETLVTQLNDPDFHRYIGDRGVRTSEDALRYMEERIWPSYREHEFGMWLAELHDGTPAGMVGLISREGLDDVDIGFAFLPGHRGKGLAREAAEAALEVAARRFGLTRIVAITSQDNEASGRLLERLGFAYERDVVLPDDDAELRLWALSLNPPDPGSTP